MKSYQYIIALATILSMGLVGVSYANALTGGSWWWTYNDVSAGDCNMHNIKLTINKDGSVIWDSQVSSSGSDDSMGVKGLSLLDNHGVTLWTFGDFWSPTINNNNIVFKQVLFYPAHLYKWIVSPSGITVHC